MCAVVRSWQVSPQDDWTSRVPRPETILVPLTDRNDAMNSLPVARAFAQLANATLHVLCWSSESLDPKQRLKQLGITPDDVHGGILGAVDGTPEALTRLAQGTANPLVVVSARPVEEDVDSLGPVCESVLTSAPTQVVVVPPEHKQSWHMRRILLAHDGSPTADAAICTTAHLALRAGAEVIALHVASRKAPQISEIGSFPAPRYIDQPQHEWPSWANEFVQRMMTLGASPAAINFKLLVTGGQPGSEIAQFAKDHEADLVVMVWHGRWESERAGTLKVVIRRSECPVFLICIPDTQLGS
jgi:nucleotide-binding universal stress UspA family protein